MSIVEQAPEATLSSCNEDTLSSVDTIEKTPGTCQTSFSETTFSDLLASARYRTGLLFDSPDAALALSETACFRQKTEIKHELEYRRQLSAALAVERSAASSHSEPNSIIAAYPVRPNDYVLEKNAQVARSMPEVTLERRSVPLPRWHAPWKLVRVTSGHTGWVRSIAVDVGNEWFVTGAGDRMIKIWDLASGELKLSLTGHVSAVRGLALSTSRPYLFSAGEDKMIKCWDLETNKVVRHYHGHLSGIYALALHPSLDLLATGGRDCCVRMWDVRTRSAVHILTGHSSTIGSLIMQSPEFQLISASLDSTIRLWDIRMGRSLATLTHHKKSVRAVALHPNEMTFVSASPDNIKQWVMLQKNTVENPKQSAVSEFPDVRFVQNFSGHRGIPNCVAVNSDNVLATGGDNGSLHLWDWRSGYNFQSTFSQVQPGSLDAEAGIFAIAFDKSGSRLITCEADKTIKMWREDENATPETHPIKNWKPELRLK